MKECKSNDLSRLILFHPRFNDNKINEFKNEITDYIQQNNIDGAIFSNMPRKVFSEKLIGSINNNKIRGPANKTWDRIIQFDFSEQITKEKYVSSNKASAIPEVSHTSSFQLPQVASLEESHACMINNK